MNFDSRFMKHCFVIISFTIILLQSLQHFDTILFLLQELINLVSPFLVGSGIAFIINIPMSFLEDTLFLHRDYSNKKSWARPLCLSLTLIIIIGISCAVFFLIIPQLIHSLSMLTTYLPNYFNQLNNILLDLSRQFPYLEEWIPWLKIDSSLIMNKILSISQILGSAFLSSTLNLLGSFINVVLTTIISFIFSIYCLLQKEDLARQAKKILFAFVPMKYADSIIYILQLTCKTFINFFSGQCLEAIILGCLFFITMSIFHFPYPLLVSVLITVSSVIPLFGPFLSCFIATFLITMVNPLDGLWFLILFLILQQIEGNIIYPHIVGKSIGLPPMWVLVAVTVGGKLMGIIGMLLFIPVASILYTLFTQYTKKAISKQNSSI